MNTERTENLRVVNHPVAKVDAVGTGHGQGGLYK